MSHKWDWLADRIRECGYPTVTAFANAIAWKPSRLSEMINDISVNGGKVRNFPKNKIGIVSELLHIPPMNLIAYNNDIVSRMVFDDTAQNTTVQIIPPFFILCAKWRIFVHSFSFLIKKFTFNVFFYLTLVTL